MAVITVRDEGFEKLKEEIKLLNRKVVKVGFDEKSGVHERSGKQYRYVAAVNEFGTDNIPSRPFMRRTADIASEADDSLAEEINAFNRNPNHKSFLMNHGSMVRSLMGRQIESTEWVDNAPYTIQKKGFNSPLRETYEMESRIALIVDGKRVSRI